MHTPALMTISNASIHDITVAKELLDNVFNVRVFGDTAFADKEWQPQMLSEQSVEIITPIKRKKWQKELLFGTEFFQLPFQMLNNPLNH